jgi:uncharacterized protein (DUF885 family)
MKQFHLLMGRACAVFLLFVSTPTLAGPADTAFDRTFGPGFFDEFWSLNPGYGISVGYYKYADRLPAPDDKTRAAQLAFVDRWQRKLHTIDRGKLDPAHQADWALLDTEFESRRWELNELRAWQWNPSNYNVAEGFSALLTTEYAPLETRLRTIAKRLPAVPAYYAAAKRNVQEPTREHTQLAIEQNGGALAVLERVREKVVASSLSASEKAQIDERIAAAHEAVTNYVGWLTRLGPTLTPGNARSFRLGGELYERKFAYDIQSGGTARALYDRAVADKEQLHARMNVLADQLWPKYFPNTPVPNDRLEKIGKLIDKLSEQHVPREQFFPEVERLIPELARWVTDHKLLTLDADKPLKVRPTPVHQRGVALASIDAPGPYDPTAPTWFNVMPLEDLPAERAEGLLREYNRFMLPILNIHEAIPGHYAQLVYANKSPSRIKTIFGNGAMIEGWAVYGERMMLESGYGDDTAEMWLIYSKWILRSVCNTILDYSVHVLDLSEADTKRMLVREAFQSAEEASGKWRRLQLTSVQLTSYYAGYAGIYELREQLKRERPNFDLKAFHEEFLSYGNAPVGVIATLMRVGIEK